MRYKLPAAVRGGENGKSEVENIPAQVAALEDDRIRVTKVGGIPCKQKV